MGHQAVEKLEVVDETIFIGTAVHTADEIARRRLVVQLAKI